MRNLNNKKRFIFLCLIVTLLFVSTACQTVDGIINNKKMDNNQNIDVIPLDVIDDLEIQNDNNLLDDKSISKNEEIDVPIKPVELLFSFAGDCTIGGDLIWGGKPVKEDIFTTEWKHQNKDYSFFFKNVRSIFEKDDATIINLEGPLTTATKRADKKFAFKGHPSFANILTEGSIEVATIANNHIYDYGEQGLNNTTKALNENGVLYSHEQHIAYNTYNNIKVAFLSYNGWGLWAKDMVEKGIKEAKENGADIILVSFHWGEERKYIPNKIQRQLGQFAIDQGATIVVGHHPHVIQGIEIYKGRYIAYSLANFSFGGNYNPKDRDTFIFQTTITLDPNTKEIKHIKPNIIPCSISSIPGRNNFQPTPLEGAEKNRILNRIFEGSKVFEEGIKEEDLHN
ncbi:CapA family protein [Xylanivirga thermophila]|jgi:poly-gamma-glutamate capsule biosynthesis protein CapA/YwtB (metallophosphatase superfamily)|uniref:CapA family protein n=1 Tax=Xylanivirga thermophila TaxID=2496273 RepID=UPI00101D27F2|nr:CapA family protein [Xylanivirga thermophila]